MPQASNVSVRRELARYVREQTGNGQEVVDLMLAILRDEVVDKNKKPIKVTLRMQYEAGHWLIDRGYGKAPQEISVEAGYSPDAAELEEWDLEKLNAALEVVTVDAVVPN